MHRKNEMKQRINPLMTVHGRSPGWPQPQGAEWLAYQGPGQGGEGLGAVRVTQGHALAQMGQAESTYTQFSNTEANANGGHDRQARIDMMSFIIHLTGLNLLVFNDSSFRTSEKVQTCLQASCVESLYFVISSNDQRT